MLRKMVEHFSDLQPTVKNTFPLKKKVSFVTFINAGLTYTIASSIILKTICQKVRPNYHIRDNLNAHLPSLGTWLEHLRLLLCVFFRFLLFRKNSPFYPLHHIHLPRPDSNATVPKLLKLTGS